MNDYSAVPAGWYPDPLGLPQLRWWDNHAWTEHVAEARQPMVVQDARTTTEYAWPEDEAPSRRERRERERAGASGVDRNRPTAQALLALPAPSVETRQDEPAPGFGLGFGSPASAGFGSPASAGLGSVNSVNSVNSASAHSAGSATSFGDDNWTYQSGGFGQNWSASSIPSAGSVGSASDLYDPRTRAGAPAPAAVGNWVHTPFVWMIALLPLLQLLLTLVLVSSVGLQIAVQVFLGIWLAPYFLVIVFAFLDYRQLRRMGFEHAAHWLWALATPPGYLLARASRTVRASGRGFSPLVSWFGTGILLLSSILLVPGILIAAMPDVFRAEAEASVLRNAALIGKEGDLVAKCPPATPTVIGQNFVCMATNDLGHGYYVNVSLERLNGWIEWRVGKWGVFSTPNDTAGQNAERNANDDGGDTATATE